MSRILSLAVERSLDMGEVVGSIPAGCTIAHIAKLVKATASKSVICRFKSYYGYHWLRSSAG